MSGMTSQGFRVAPDAMEVVGARIAEWCKREPAKELARALSAEYRTVEGWRDGRPPALRHLAAMVEYWGSAFIEDVFADALEARPGDYAARARRIRAEIDLMEVEHAGIMARLAAADAALAHGAGRGGAGGSAAAFEPLSRSGGTAGRLAIRAGAALMLGLVCFGAGGALLDFDDHGFLRARAPRPSVVRVIRAPVRAAGGRVDV